MASSLSEAEVEAYGRDGYLGPVVAVGAEEAAGLLRRIAAFEAEHGVVAGEVIRNKGHLKAAFLCDLVSDPRILDAIESILGPDILCWGSSLFVKEAGDPGYVAWHQDSHYWGLTPDDVVSAWIAFAASTVENGAMCVVPGSHREAAHAHGPSAASSANMLFTHEEIADPVDESRAVPVLLAQGEMSLHHVNLIHGSGPNRSAGRRCGYAIRYVAPHVRQRGDMASALLVRGRDRYGHFAPDPLPERDMDPEIVAFVDAPLGAKPKGAR